MNLILLEPGEVADGRVELDGRRARHLIAVLGAAPGAEVRVGVIGGPRGRATVVSAGVDRVGLTVALDQPPSPAPRVALVLALPRPKALGRALETAAAAGVARVDLTNAWRVDKAYFASPKLVPAALREHLVLGCEQGATTFLPELALHRRFMTLLDGPPPWPPGAVGLVLHPHAARPIEAVVAPGDARPVVIAIGPEGGFIARELASLEARGFAAVTLGPAVLRTEHAVAAALAQLELLGRLG